MSELKFPVETHNACSWYASMTDHCRYVTYNVFVVSLNSLLAPIRSYLLIIKWISDQKTQTNGRIIAEKKKKNPIRPNRATFFKQCKWPFRQFSPVNWIPNGGVWETKVISIAFTWFCRNMSWWNACDLFASLGPIRVGGWNLIMFLSFYQSRQRKKCTINWQSERISLYSLC